MCFSSPLLAKATILTSLCTKATQAVIHAAVEHAIEHGEEIAEDNDVVEVEDVDSEIEAVAVDSGSEAVAADPDSETVVTVDSNSETIFENEWEKLDFQPGPPASAFLGVHENVVCVEIIHQMDVLPNELKKDWSKELTVKKETHYAVEESHGLCVGQDYPMAKIEVELDVQRWWSILIDHPSWWIKRNWDDTGENSTCSAELPEFETVFEAQMKLAAEYERAQPQGGLHSMHSAG
ncbi:hypothetical protein C8J57DRAFT_1228016 [Mycena rebaudengoi]|nr:hypothetical protein C8J57DRAFT_1228016 [Mycena rebaudengoi]